MLHRTITGRLAVVCAVFLAAGPAAAETVFHAELDGPTAGTPSPAVGSATLILNDDQTEVAYTVEYSGLVGFEGAAHIHRGAPGTNGPVLLPLPTGTPKTGVWPVTPTLVSLLFDGLIYINVHTNVYPDGEIRGDVGFQSVSETTRSWGGIKALFRSD